MSVFACQCSILPVTASPVITERKPQLEAQHQTPSFPSDWAGNMRSTTQGSGRQRRRRAARFLTHLFVIAYLNRGVTCINSEAHMCSHTAITKTYGFFAQIQRS
jgi:hypothetical protein